MKWRHVLLQKLNALFCPALLEAFNGSLLQLNARVPKFTTIIICDLQLALQLSPHENEKGEPCVMLIFNKLE